MYVTKHRACEICGLEPLENKKRVLLFPFPLDEERCKEWVRLTGLMNLIDIPIEEIHIKKFLCENHFGVWDFLDGKNLKNDAIPHRLFTREPVPDEFLAGFPLHLYSSDDEFNGTHASPANEKSTNTCKNTITKRRIRKKTRDHLRNQSHSRPSNVSRASKQKSGLPLSDSTSCSINILEHDYCMRKESSDAEDYTHSNSLSDESVDFGNPAPCMQWTENDQAVDTKAPVFNRASFRNYSHSSNKKQLDESRTTIKLRKQLKKTRTELRIAKRRLTKIERTSTPFLKGLIECSINHEKRKPNGKRWPNLVMNVVREIYTISPKAYKCLSRVLPMPNVRTVQSMRGSESNPISVITQQISAESFRHMPVIVCNELLPIE